jgi:hypothetical protein
LSVLQLYHFGIQWFIVKPFQDMLFWSDRLPRVRSPPRPTLGFGVKRLRRFFIGLRN